ncbi:DNA-binding response regulator [Lysinibacillus sp. 2017]|uniref:response regulator transcription factor n=1 Tax=unclassified Lysinibacillus TaxID=2636778 RepID=UPI000D52875F|nr:MULTISPECIES: response regulator transcription factor [unclassified Lysinibacillus]AWE07277.1 DNA-binding response regulator [Lysinibacillus sp. 2017]TGN33334.1 response regulator transcription factor [Lysinibacillus sp. S2017]
MHILVVDDDPFIRKLIGIHLKKNGYDALFASNGIEALEMVNHHTLDLAIVDVMMPKMDGISLTERLTAKEIPVLLLTAKTALEDKEKGFLAGADDYMVKPFEPKELLFRIQAILRRYQKLERNHTYLGNMLIDRLTYEVKVGEQVLLLPLKEFELLSILCSKPELVFSREQLMEQVWGYDYNGDDYTLTTHIKRLRARLEEVKAAVKIQTVRGIGYKIEELK